MYDLTLTDIREWLIVNRTAYQKLASEEFPPFDNPLYSMYRHLKNFIGYYTFKHKCDQYLQLKAIDDFDVKQLSAWTKEYELLGSQDLLIFEVDYMDWTEEVSPDKIKIHEGLYTERKPFASIICFCMVFQVLYWDYCLHESIPSEQEWSKLKIQLSKILTTNHIGTGGDS